MKLGVLKIGVDVAAVVDKQSLEQQYPKLFQGVGKLNSKQVSLHINPEEERVRAVAEAREPENAADQREKHHHGSDEYVRSIDHAMTGKSPAELLFNRKMRGKLPDVTEPRTDTEVRDRDSERKGKSKLYTDERRRARHSDVEVSDTVLVRQDKVDKFTTTFNATPHKVVSKTGSHVIVESPAGARYERNSTFVKKYQTNQERNKGQNETHGVEDVIVDYKGTQ
ncbi:hypothetical protein AAFF_G00126820 [Aldrovandia affinis]|uniref:Uncharacterized protein n=1 Tax=Aldrovandia affinis TaxID=143900 RepID=A0AAD7R0V0_9TELE|nr:hypothetical protein AAFF_G00126820 [Aldrovandia affinis]